MSENNTQFFISAKVETITENGAGLVLENGERINWPIDKLPYGTSKDQVIKLKIVTLEQNNKEKDVMARAILNEILKKG